MFIKQHVRCYTTKQEWTDAPSLPLKALSLNHYFLIREMYGFGFFFFLLCLFIPNNNDSYHLLSAYNMPGILL